MIDAKKYKGRVEQRDVGGWFRTDRRLYVGGRDRSKLVDGLDRQIEAVWTALGDDEIPVHAALCFVEADWKLFAKPFEQEGVWVTGAKSLAKMIDKPGLLTIERIAIAADRLASALPPVSTTSLER